MVKKFRSKKNIILVVTNLPLISTPNHPVLPNVSQLLSFFSILARIFLMHRQANPNACSFKPPSYKC